MRVNPDGSRQELGSFGHVWTGKGHQPSDVVRFFEAVADQTQLRFEAAAVVDDGRGLFAIARVPTSHRQTLMSASNPLGEEDHL